MTNNPLYGENILPIVSMSDPRMYAQVKETVPAPTNIFHFKIWKSCWINWLMAEFKELEAVV